jgi:hypothetical protein
VPWHRNPRIGGDLQEDAKGEHGERVVRGRRAWGGAMGVVAGQASLREFKEECLQGFAEVLFSMRGLGDGDG